LAFEFIDRAKDEGVEVKTNYEVTDIELRNGRVSGVQTAKGRSDADHVISAAGPWNPMTADMGLLSLPLQHTLAPILQLKPSDPVRYMVPHTKHVETRVYFRGCTDGTVFVGKNPNEITPFEEAEQFNPNEVSNTVSEEVRAELFEIVELLYPELTKADIVSEWVGIRSMTPDGYPIVGWTSVPGFSVAGFNSSGINLAPAVGEIIARQLVNDEETEFYDDISITRFDGFRDTKTG
jgi:glycine/D-amino acid oxidase-like deaminating enzyme